MKIRAHRTPRLDASGTKLHTRRHFLPIKLLPSELNGFILMVWRYPANMALAKHVEELSRWLAT